MDQRGWGLLLAALMACAAGTAAAEPLYRCAGKHGVIYTDKPCTGAHELGAARPNHVDDRYVVPPQDRAKAARRAELTPEARATCEDLDRELVDAKEALAKLPQPVTPTDERDLVTMQLKYHKLRCY